MTDERGVAAGLWSELGGAPHHLESLQFTGTAGGLPSRFHVSTLAAAAIGVATLAAAELWALRTGKPVRRVTVDRRLASAAFKCEHYLSPKAAGWDPIAGDYEAADGWIRLHTNYSYHRAASLRALQCPEDRKSVATTVKAWKKDALESAIVAQHGCAAALRRGAEWKAHPQGRALDAEPLVSWDGVASPMEERASPDAPLAGVRVLDLTRVIAGPIGTRHLAALGAEVLRIDPPGFEEVALLLPETTRGKRRAFLDLKSADGRASLQRLVDDADVLVHGYRPGTLESLGLKLEKIVRIRYDAYGWSGPWAGRRGFDSLVQMSCGIAHPGSDGKPAPLPAQALDYGTGYLVAAAACRVLVDRKAEARLALARTAKRLMDLGEDGDPRAPGLGDVSDLLESVDSDFGPLRQVRQPGAIEGYDVKWKHAAGPLGVHPAAWASG